MNMNSCLATWTLDTSVSKSNTALLLTQRANNNTVQQSITLTYALKQLLGKGMREWTLYCSHGRMVHFLKGAKVLNVCIFYKEINETPGLT